jgi:SAM-dependent methyltransferase
MPFRIGIRPGVWEFARPENTGQYMSNSVTISRAEFAERQAAMTARWASGAHERGDAEILFAKRRAAYLDRWSEALRFIPEGSRILDVGGGNGFAELYDALRAKRLEYHYLDVDPAAVSASREIAAGCGLDPSNFNHGFNDQLPHEDGAFDYVFSSHCVEHSFDLLTTLAEVRRVLRPEGSLLMAVPFGWESNPEHPYFLGPNEWVALLQDTGFTIRTAQIGCEYPEHGFDYFVCARRAGEVPNWARIDPRAYCKTTYTFASLDDLAPVLSGDWRREANCLIGAAGASIAWTPPADADVALPVVARHDWSGVVDAQWGGHNVRETLFSWFSYPMPFRLTRGPSGGAIELRALGHSPCSIAGELVVYGVLYGRGQMSG